jgi:hypothetical protein
MHASGVTHGSHSIPETGGTPGQMALPGGAAQPSCCQPLAVHVNMSKQQPFS